jgi:hypothetical protein
LSFQGVSLCQPFPLWKTKRGQVYPKRVDGQYRYDNSSFIFLSFKVPLLGFEPRTDSLEGCCSIR